MGPRGVPTVLLDARLRPGTPLLAGSHAPSLTLWVPRAPGSPVQEGAAGCLGVPSLPPGTGRSSSLSPCGRGWSQRPQFACWGARGPRAVPLKGRPKSHRRPPTPKRLTHQPLRQGQVEEAQGEGSGSDRWGRPVGPSPPIPSTSPSSPAVLLPPETLSQAGSRVVFSSRARDTGLGSWPGSEPQGWALGWDAAPALGQESVSTVGAVGSHHGVLVTK